MNIYNQAVVDQFCREVRYTAKQKEKLIQKLVAMHGDKLDKEDFLSISSKTVTVEGTLTKL